LLAAERARIYWRLQDERKAGVIPGDVVKEIRIQERVITQRQ